MIPPASKPASPSVEDAEAQDADIGPDTESSAEPDKSPAKAASGRRRAATMELRIANRRNAAAAAAAEDADDPDAAPKSGRANAGRTNTGRASSGRAGATRAGAARASSGKASSGKASTSRTASGRANAASANADSITSDVAEVSETRSAEAEAGSTTSGPTTPVKTATRKTTPGKTTPAKTGSLRSGRAQSTGLRQGPRAQQRAAKAALLEASAQPAQEDPASPADAATPIAQPPVTPAVVAHAAEADQPAPQPPAPAQAPTAAETAPYEPAPDEPARPEPAPYEPAAVAAPTPRRRALAGPSPEIAPPPATPAPLPSDPAGEDDDDTEEERTPGRRRPKGEKRGPRASTKPTDAAHYVVAPPVNMAEMRPRHYGVIAAFILMVVLPTLSYSWYLWTKAADQYESTVGFGSRTEEASSTFDFLGALGGVSQSGANDMDILYEFIVSQELVAKVDRELDLKAIYTKATDDPLNSFNRDGTIEDLVAFWRHMVKVNYDKATGLMSLQVFAFEPEDAQRIARMILVESTQIINDLSMTAQEDTTRYSKEAMTNAEQKLSEARLAVLDYQIKNGIVDPTNTIATQNSIIGTLNQQLAAAQVELDLLAGTVSKGDLRIATLNRKIDVIRNRIAVEQAKVGAAGDADSLGFALLMQEFERLKVDLDFAGSAYLSARAAYDQAVADAQHKTRYLTSFVEPTLAEASTAPNRPLAALIVAIVGFLLWSISILMYYALRDRR